jgi:hypothetical protein
VVLGRFFTVVFGGDLVAVVRAFAAVLVDDLMTVGRGVGSSVVSLVGVEQEAKSSATATARIFVMAEA